MVSIAESPYTQEQVTVWLRGLLSMAWADGHFDEEEKVLITDITQDELAPSLNFESFEPISPEILAQTLPPKSEIAENFLRMAVMVALADGVYSTEEDEMLIGFCHALELDAEVLASLQSTLFDLKSASAPASAPASGLTPPAHGDDHKLDPLAPAREWLDKLDVHDQHMARFLCKMIPSQCPFERDVKLFGHKIVHIPPMCKINPLYEQLVGLRFRALSYLADDCGEDVTPYV
ncbi:MAG: Mo-dependent nitrogenase C-terminal domain-containing protein [Cyanobacteria bacterium P01_A01_bin.123]